MLIGNEELRSELIKLKANYVFIASAIRRPECSGVFLSESLSIISDTVQRLTECPDGAVEERTTYVLRRNSGLKTLSSVAT